MSRLIAFSNSTNPPDEKVERPRATGAETFNVSLKRFWLSLGAAVSTKRDGPRVSNDFTHSAYRGPDLTARSRHSFPRRSQMIANFAEPLPEKSEVGLVAGDHFKVLKEERPH